ncbi:hypothetical protein CDD82_7448 [Ophiocordyceps australis]|uniref:NmrA-like family domain-containing protein 1 n=1 Tax=Ophiocordyceps australis TaxID=1399860 RepID=A0A2C5ZRL0_9HYPO|nr:hypothetical protein CDD82_7448 [Ophiocordyceps australis]
MAQKLITVFGATGNQGGSVIKHILADPVLSKEFKIRGITRDTTKPAAQALSKQGVELKSADLNSEASIKEAISGSHTVFLVTNFWESLNAEMEIRQGKNVADAAKEEGVSHLIFSSLLNVTELTQGRLKHVPHFDDKAEVERYIKTTGVPCTFVMPGYFMSNLPGMMKKAADGSYELAYPISEKSEIPLFATAEDMGKFVNAAIKNAASLNGKQVLAATDYYTVERMLSEFEQVTGKKATFTQVTAEQYKSFLPEAMAQEVLETHLFTEKPGYFNGMSLKESLALLDERPTTWKDFVKNSTAFQ